MPRTTIYRLFISAFVISLFWVVSTQIVIANTYYVSPTGNDSNSGNSLSSPFRTISKCVATFGSGDSCLIRGGTYLEFVDVKRSGSQSAPATIATYQGEQVTIDGQHTRSTMRLNSINHLVIRGLHLANSATFALESVSSSNISITDCQVSYPRDGGLVFRNGSNILVEKCNVHHTNDRGLSANHESVTFQNIDGFEIRNSQVWGGKEEGIDAKYGSRNGKIHSNTVYGNNGPNIYVDGASSIDIYNNHIHSPSGDKPNISIAVETSWNPNRYTVSNIRIFNNIIRNSPAGVSFWVEADESWISIENIQIFNNVFYGNTNRGAIRLNGYNKYVNNVVVKNNIFWRNSNSVDNLTNTTTSFNFFDSKPVGANASTASSAGFVNEGAYDFRLTTDSPAIGKGENGTNPGLTGQQQPTTTTPPSPSHTPTPSPTLSPTPLPSPTPSPTPTIKPGDFNKDGKVDLFDYNLVITNFGKPYSIFDYNLVLTYFGN